MPAMQRTVLGVVLALSAALCGQADPAAAAKDDLTQLRAAFARLPVADRTVVIAVVQGGEPVILTAGSDAGGKDVTPESLLPLFGLAKVLAADAIHAQLKGKVDKPSGEKFGDRELTVRELLDGTQLLPDYFVFDGSEGTVDGPVLRACGALADGAKVKLRASTLGAPEFVLLEPLAFAGRYQDWTSMLRSTLAPSVPGLDPLSAEALSEQARSHACLVAEDLAKLAGARPALLRTMLSVKNVATWLQWRAQHEVPLWSSVRMGHTKKSLTQPNEQVWTMSVTAMSTDLYVVHLPSRKAAFLWFSPSTPRTVGSSLTAQRAFEEDLFAADREAVASPRPGGRAVPPARPAEATASPLAGTRWSSAGAGGPAAATRLVISAGAKGPMVLTLGDGSWTFGGPYKTGEGWFGTTRDDGPQHTLWLWPQPDAEKPAKLSCVLLTWRVTGGNATSAGVMGSSIPKYLELVPESK
jgi:hypothetical protein